MSRRMAVVPAVLLSFWLIAVLAPPAMAHLHEQVGDIEFTVGWSTEPAFAGEPNSVQVSVTQGPAEPAGGQTHEEGTEEEGPPVPPRQVKLTVEVIFGDKDSTVKMPAVPLESFAFGAPGEWRTETIVPSRAGTYTFHVTGAIKGKAVDKYYTSGSKGAIEGTEFSDVREVAAVSFPAKDPSNNELARALAAEKLAAAKQVKDAKDDASMARMYAFIGIAFGLMGVGLALRPRGKKATS